jgi:hypothetical protein
MKKSVEKIALTKTGKPNKAVKNMLMNCNFHVDGQVGTGYYSGSGRFTTRHSALNLVESLLKAGGYKYEVSNLGGAAQEHVKLSKVAKQFLIDIRSAN